MSKKSLLIILIFAIAVSLIFAFHLKDNTIKDDHLEKEDISENDNKYKEDTEIKEGGEVIEFSNGDTMIIYPEENEDVEQEKEVIIIDSDKPSEEPSDLAIEFENYTNMSGEDQEKFFNSFESQDDFFEWYNNAKKAYEDSLDEIIIGESSEIVIE